MAAPFLQRFGEVFPATFLERPNRFRVRCRVRSAGDVDAFMPNPGRLWELLFPGVKLWIAKTPKSANGQERRTQYTVLAVERDGAPVFLHTHVNNEVARLLLEEGRVPTLENASIGRSEITVGRSRFDFLLEQDGRDVYCEVKSCTLFGNGVAMFPDAVTERGRRHLLELAELAEGGARSVVLFIVHAPGLRYFMPDYHTDLAFSRTLLGVRHDVDIVPLSVEWTDTLDLKGESHRLDIPWSFIDQEAHDRGDFILLLRFPKPVSFALSAHRTLSFPEGFVLATGHLEQNLFKRLERWRKPGKTDTSPEAILCREAAHVLPLPVCGSKRRVGAIAEALAEHFTPLPGPPALPLFHSPGNPLENPVFHEVLQQFRMRRP